MDLRVGRLRRNHSTSPVTFIYSDARDRKVDAYESLESAGHWMGEFKSPPNLMSLMVWFAGLTFRIYKSM
ncbi:hypothetical protein D3C72_2341640 [compost metagenome]